MVECRRTDPAKRVQLHFRSSLSCLILSQAVLSLSSLSTAQGVPLLLWRGEPGTCQGLPNYAIYSIPWEGHDLLSFCFASVCMPAGRLCSPSLQQMLVEGCKEVASGLPQASATRADRVTKWAVQSLLTHRIAN